MLMTTRASVMAPKSLGANSFVRTIWTPNRTTCWVPWLNAPHRRPDDARPASSCSAGRAALSSWLSAVGGRSPAVRTFTSALAGSQAGRGAAVERHSVQVHRVRRQAEQPVVPDRAHRAEARRGGDGLRRGEGAPPEVGEVGVVGGGRVVLGLEGDPVGSGDPRIVVAHPVETGVDLVGPVPLL